jgi:hypothetical protein
MRKFISAALLSITFVIFVSGCKDDDPTSRDIATDALINDSKPWIINGGTVTLDGNDVSDSFVGFEIMFTGTTYTSSNGGDVWPDGTNATWMYKGTDENVASTIIRGDQVEVQIIVTKGSQLIMTFTVTDTSGRISGLSGNYSFDLKSGA